MRNSCVVKWPALQRTALIAAFSGDFSEIAMGAGRVAGRRPALPGIFLLVCTCHTKPAMAIYPTAVLVLSHIPMELGLAARANASGDGIA